MFYRHLSLLLCSFIVFSFIQVRDCFIKPLPSSISLYSSTFGRTMNHQNPPISHPKSTELHGIPKLFRWLVDLYPVVLESVRDGLTSKNAMAIDNFYLDMNGIIHACTHSNNDKLIAFNEVQMFQRIFAYTDNLYKLVKPSKLMYLAVDGVAPRAKQNQQRSRRFRSSKEREVLLAEYVAKEGKLPDDESFDSNCITPGTQFMHRLGIAFRSWMQYKMKTDEFWKTNGATVVFSGPDVPGEGEHKVMDMIRSIQEEKGYVLGSLRHCMYGLDADLIMLSLATHEPHFVLLREKIHKRKLQHKDSKSFSQEDFELLEITLLRQMLRQHFRKLPIKKYHPLKTLSVAEAEHHSNSNNVEESPAEEVVDSSTSIWKKLPKSSEMMANEERIIDDFIFMCYFIGNDFLPSMPHLDISDGSLNHLMDVYRDMIPKLGGFLTDGCNIHLARVELYIQEIARREALYFQQRAITDKEPEFATSAYRDHYYKIKFGIEPGDEESIRKVVDAYIHGLFWVLEYYHNGCGSWQWYYPYLYAPLASDVKNLNSINISFARGVPFTPLLQLLSVLPPQSGKFLPEAYENYMVDPASPLSQYYPKDFEVDPNGKKNSWECIVKIPFIDETVLIDTISLIDHNLLLTDEEKSRNVPGQEFRVYPPHMKEHHQRGQIVVNDMAIQRSVEGAASHANIDTKATRWGNALFDDVRRLQRTPGHTSPRGSHYSGSSRPRPRTEGDRQAVEGQRRSLGEVNRHNEIGKEFSESKPLRRITPVARDSP